MTEQEASLIAVLDSQTKSGRESVSGEGTVELRVRGHNSQVHTGR
jgi:hypothetical protein